MMPCCLLGPPPSTQPWPPGQHVQTAPTGKPGSLGSPLLELLHQLLQDPHRLPVVVQLGVHQGRELAHLLNLQVASQGCWGGPWVHFQATAHREVSQAALGTGAWSPPHLPDPRAIARGR